MVSGVHGILIVLDLYGSGAKINAFNVGDPVKSLGQEDPLKKEMVTQTSVLAWGNYISRGTWQGGGEGYNPFGSKDQTPVSH